jgi:hypothetical protein
MKEYFEEEECGSMIEWDVFCLFRPEVQIDIQGWFPSSIFRRKISGVFAYSIGIIISINDVYYMLHHMD